MRINQQIIDSEWIYSFVLKEKGLPVSQTNMKRKKKKIKTFYIKLNGVKKQTNKKNYT